MEAAHTFLYGVLAGLSLVVVMFFVRYWRVTKDRFFIFIGATFLLLALGWGTLATLRSSEFATYAYSLRLVAFVILIAGIADKNRR